MQGRPSFFAALAGGRLVRGLALLAAVGGVLAVSHQLERGLKTDLGPLGGPAVRPSGLSIVQATLPRQRPVVPTQLQLQRPATLPAIAAPAEAPALEPARAAPAVRPASKPLPPTAPEPQPPAPPPAPPAPAPKPTPPAPEPTPPATLASVPVETPPAAAPTRPGWGRGDKDHTHTGPPGRPSTTEPPAEQAASTDAPAVVAPPAPSAAGQSVPPADTAQPPSPAEHGNGNGHSPSPRPRYGP